MDELDNYGFRTNQAGRDSWGAFEFQKHDDVVTSLALSLWSCVEFGGPIMMW